MKPEIKSKWLAALRSGEYKQGDGCLHYDGKFCCLGVLCDLHAKETGEKWAQDDRLSEELSYYENKGTLPRIVMEWAEIPKTNPYLGEERASAWNDGEEGRIEPQTFPQIADKIERYL